MILLVSYSGAFGGAERVLVDVAPVLDGDPTLACPEGPLAQAARKRGLTVLALPSGAWERVAARRPAFWPPPV